MSNGQQPISVQEYQKLLEKLLAEGKGFEIAGRRGVRIGINLDANVVLPVQFDPGLAFTAGSRLVLPQEQVAELAEALDDIKSGKMSPEQALLRQKDGKTLSIFDAYGINTGMMDNLGYEEVPLSEETKKIAARFRTAASPPAVNPDMISAQEYAKLLERLLKEGTGFGFKGEIVVMTRNDGAYFTTQKSDGTNYAVARDVAQARRLVKKGFEASDLSEPGIELKTIRSVTRGYKLSPRDETGMYFWRPNPEAFRVGLAMTEDAVIPSWSSSGAKITPGSTLMIAQKDVKELSEALLSIKEGRATAEEALYRKDGLVLGDAIISKFEVFVVPPDAKIQDLGFVPVELSKDTKEISAQFGNAALKLKKLHAQMYPERATFKKKTLTPV